MTNIEMKIVILGNLRINKENITLETKVHQTITTDRKIQIIEAHQKIEMVQLHTTLEIHTLRELPQE